MGENNTGHQKKKPLRDFRFRTGGKRRPQGGFKEQERWVCRFIRRGRPHPERSKPKERKGNLNRVSISTYSRKRTHLYTRRDLWNTEGDMIRRKKRGEEGGGDEPRAHHWENTRGDRKPLWGYCTKPYGPSAWKSPPERSLTLVIVSRK